MNKEERYKKLVGKFKRYSFSENGIRGLENPFEIKDPRKEYKCDHLSPWAIWQGDLDADIMIIGQDFGSNEYFRGKLKKRNGDLNYEENNETNLRLVELLRDAGIEIRMPYEKFKVTKKLYFTNAVLGLKKGKMSGKIKSSWYQCTVNFLKELIQIIKPKVIITLGNIPLQTVKCIYMEINIPDQIGKAINKHYDLKKDNMVLYPMYHCSPLAFRKKHKEYWKDLRFELLK